MDLPSNKTSNTSEKNIQARKPTNPKFFKENFPKGIEQMKKHLLKMIKFDKGRKN